MVHIMKDSFSITKSMGKELTYGSKIENMKANGEIIKCMEKVEFNGQMAKYTMASMKTIKSTVQVLLAGQMEENMLASGNKENNMDEGNIFYLMVVER